MYIRFRIKAHRKLSDSARTFNRAALKSDENRDLLNQAYISARDEYDQLFPPLPQSILSDSRINHTASVSGTQKNSLLEYPREALWDHAAYLSHPGAPPEPLSKSPSATVFTRYRPDFSLKYMRIWWAEKPDSGISLREPLGPRGIPLAPRSPTRTALKVPPGHRFHPISARFLPQIHAYLVGRKSRFRNIPARALGPRGIPYAPPSDTRTASTVTPSARPHPLLSPRVQLFYAQRVFLIYRCEIVPIPTRPHLTPSTDTRTRCSHQPKSSLHPKTATGARNFLQLTKRLRAAKRLKKVEAETEKAGQAIQQWQGAWVGEQEDLPNEDEDDWKMVAIDDVRFNKHEPDASTLDAKWQRKVQVNGQSRIVTKCEPIKIGDVISCPTWGPRAHRYASPQVAASDWLLLQIVP